MSYTQLELIPGMGWVRQPLIAKSEPAAEVVEEVVKAVQGYLPGMGIFNPAIGSGKVGATHHILTNSEAQEAIYAAEIAKHMAKPTEEKAEEKSAPAVWLDFKVGDKIQTSQGVGIVEGIEADGSLTVKSQGRLFTVEMQK